MSFIRAARDAIWGANSFIGEMYRDGEGVAVNIRKSIHHFEIYAKHERDEGHWNLACIYQNEEGYVCKNRALFHFRLAADLSDLNAREVVGGYFVRASGPRKLRFTNDELQEFLRIVETQFSRRNNNTWNHALPALVIKNKITHSSPHYAVSAKASTIKRRAVAL